MSSGPRPHSGGHPRTLSREAVLAERDRLLTLEPSPFRSAALRKVASSLRSINNRSPRNGA